MKRHHLVIPPSYHRALKMKAARMGVSMTDLAKILLEPGLRKELDALKGGK